MGGNAIESTDEGDGPDRDRGVGEDEADLGLGVDRIGLVPRAEEEHAAGAATVTAAALEDLAAVEEPEREAERHVGFEALVLPVFEAPALRHELERHCLAGLV